METQIKSLEDLSISKILKENPKNSSGEYDFKSLANEIMNKIYIDNGAYKYRPIEIEFYIYDKNNHNDIHVYPREAKAGKLFFHLSVMDICFESSFIEKDNTISFGGILIRALERIKDGKQILFGGPLICVNEVLNTATERVKVELVNPGEELKYTAVKKYSGKRKGINKYEKKDDIYWNAKYRFFRNDVNDIILMNDETYDFNKLSKSPRKRTYKIED